MKHAHKARHRRSEAGIALLIAIFVLLLLCIVGIALIVSSGTETALGANYRSSTNVYYAALAGLEEARGRLLIKNPDYLNVANPGFFPSPGTPVALGNAYYITNPVATEDVLAIYPDGEYSNEFGVGPTNVYRAASVSKNNTQGLPGPLFKWVRINAATEKSLNLDVDYDGQPNDNTIPLYYDPAQVNGSGSPPGSLIVNAVPPPTAVQALEITALAVLPNGSQKLLQYLVAPVPLTLPNFLPNFLSNFPAALTIAGSTTNGVAFSAPLPPNSSFYSSGVDLTGIAGCTTGSSVHAVGVLTNPDVNYVVSGGNGGTGIPTGYRPNYTGVNPTPPAEGTNVSGLFPPGLQTPSQFDTLSKVIAENADAVIPPGSNTVQTAFLSSLVSSGAMSATSPMTLVSNGDLDLTGWHNTGYGLLLVTGNLNYDPDASWQGVVMVIGKGTVTGTKAGIGEFDGAFLVAQTRDSLGNLLPDPNLGKASVTFPTMGGKGFRYSSCWIQRSQPGGNFKVLSFREIPQ